MTERTEPPSATATLADAEPLSQCRQWLERAVIGLNLCPFARAPHVGGRIRWVLSRAADSDALTHELLDEFERLRGSDPAEVETTLLVIPELLREFADYNAYLDVAEGLLAALGFAGELQIASFHPDYVFEGSSADDPANNSNRSPHPLLHLLRESSISRVVDAVGSVDDIIERNQQTLRALGQAGFERCLREPGS